MAEHSAVNRRVVSSSLTCGANLIKKLRAPNGCPFRVFAVDCHNAIARPVFLHIQNLRRLFSMYDADGLFQFRIPGFSVLDIKIDAVIKRLLIVVKFDRYIAAHRYRSLLLVETNFL